MSYTLSNEQFRSEVARVRSGSPNYELQWADLMKARAAGKKEGK